MHGNGQMNESDADVDIRSGRAAQWRSMIKTFETFPLTIIL